MYPGVDEALEAVIQTVEDEISPHVTNDLASSLCRTASQMLRSVRSRIEHEIPALDGDNAALRQHLAKWLDELPPEAANVARQAVAAGPQPRYPSLRDLTADAHRLRAALVCAIEQMPAPEHEFRAETRTYLTQQLSREKVWLQDAFSGPRR
jgi:hypothetical protein